MLKGTLKRNIFILSTVILVMFPIYNIFFIYPSFQQFIILNTKDEAIRLARHLSSITITESSELNKHSLNQSVYTQVSAVQKEFELLKLKIYAPDGEIIYSTDRKDIGKVNKKSYFHEMVAKGEVYAKVVHKETKSLEDQILRADVVETYVPVMREGKFLGAFEIYYDITERKAEMERLTTHITVILFLMTFALLIAIIIFLFKTEKSVSDSTAFKEQRRRVYQFVTLLSLSVFTAEFGIMLFLDLISPGLTTVTESFLDSFLLVILLFPILYLLSFRPMMQQIADLEQKEIALIEAERDLDNTFNSISDLISVHDREFRILRVNKALADFVGMSKDEIVGKPCFEIFHKSSAHWHVCPHVDTMDTERVSVREVNDKEKGFSFLVTTSPFYNDTGELVGSVHIARDIKEQKKAEEELKLFRFLLDNSNDSIFIIDPVTALFLDVNQKACTSLGYAYEELLKMKVTDIEAEIPDSSLWKEHVETLRERGHMLLEGVHKRKSGSLFDVEININYIPHKDRDYMIAVARDIAEKKQAALEIKRKSEELEELNRTLEKRVTEETQKRMEQERLLIQQSRIAAMGEMIGAIAHQWRQPLNAIGIMVQDVQDVYEFGELNKKYIDEIVQDAMSQIQYMSKTIDDFRNFYRSSEEVEIFCIKEAAEDAVALIESQLKHSYINITVKAEEGVRYRVYGYANEFKQVLLNIISNARGAIVEAIEESILETEKGKIDMELHRKEDLITIKIANNGKKIPKNILERIFEPYFTTKEEGEGTGIGLYMTKTIIEQHMEGKIFAENMEEGVVFTIELTAHG